METITLHNSEHPVSAEMGRGNPAPSTGAYRSEIDGLRAVSILAVVMYHAGVPGFEAGYLGVDIFFVISGFLITDQLLREAKATGTIEMAAFYARRVRRLLPAFLAMAVGTTALALMYLVPITEQRLFGNALARSAIFYYNIALWRGGYDYDGPTAREQVLMHTWSLGVEEQFYLLWPCICLLLVRLRRPLWWFITFVVGSLSGSLWMMTRDEEAVFFLLPFRVWELAAGACVAVLPWRNFQSSGGVVAVGGGLVLWGLYGGTPSPMSLSAQVIVVTGTAGILAFGRTGNPATVLLRTSPMVYLGRISYAWYLWHWPVLVVFRALTPEPGPLVDLPALALGLLLAALTHRWIERPVRRVKIKRPLLVVILGLGVFAAIFLVGSSLDLRGKQLSALPRNADHLARLAPNEIRPCERQTGSLGCVIATGVRRDSPVLLLWGDSFARALSPALSKYAAGVDVEVRLMVQPSCPPLLDVVPASRRTRPSPDLACRAFLQGAKEQLRQDSPRITAVVLAARWATHLRGSDPDSSRAMFRADGQRIEELSEALFEGLDETLDLLERRGKRAIVVGVPPEFPFDVAGCLLRERGGCSISRSWRARIREQAKGGIERAVGRHPNSRYVEMFDALCPGQRCWAGTLDEPLLRDRVHLSIPAAQSALSLLAPHLDWLIQTSRSSGPS